MCSKLVVEHACVVVLLHEESVLTAFFDCRYIIDQSLVKSFAYISGSRIQDGVTNPGEDPA
jgi:hypothetical protein